MLYIVKVHSTWTVSLHLCGCRGSTSGEYGKRRAGGSSGSRCERRYSWESNGRLERQRHSRLGTEYAGGLFFLSFSTLHFSSSSILLFFYSSLLYSHSFSPLLSSAHPEPGSGCRRRRGRTDGRRCGCARLAHERKLDAVARVLRALACVRRLGHRLLAPVALNASQPAIAAALRHTES